MDAAVEAALPRLAYIGDVPVESSYHGSALLYRLLQRYPPDRLSVIENRNSSRADRRLPGVRYRVSTGAMEQTAKYEVPQVGFHGGIAFGSSPNCAGS